MTRDAEAPLRPCRAFNEVRRCVIGLAMLLAGSATLVPSTPARQQAPAQQAPTTSSTPSPKAAGETPLQKAVHQKKVITDDDLTQTIVAGDKGTEADNDPYCDADCRDELRDEMGVAPEHELEFRNQLTLAEHEIAADSQWTSASHKASDAAQTYCTLETQKAELFSKGKSDLNNQLNYFFTQREGKLRNDERAAEGELQHRIQEVGRLDSLKAAVMQQEWNAQLRRACPDGQLP